MSGTKYLFCTRKSIHPAYINTLEKQFVQVNSFKYLETKMNTDSCIEEEIIERVPAGNRHAMFTKNYFNHD